MRWGDMRNIYNDIGKKHSRLLSKPVLGALAVLAIGAAAFAPRAKVSSDTVPSGEVTFHQSSIEPAYNDLTGDFTYFMTPKRAPEHANQKATAPLYIIMYPESASAVGVLNCQYDSGRNDNCPSHGGKLAGVAETMEHTVYASGVWGHDHLLAAPPSSEASKAEGGDFNIAWYPVIVLFKNLSAANTHITTIEQLNAEYADHNVDEIPVHSNAFQCVIVPAEQYEMGTPAY